MLVDSVHQYVSRRRGNPSQAPPSCSAPKTQCLILCVTSAFEQPHRFLGQLAWIGLAGHCSPRYLPKVATTEHWLRNTDWSGSQRCFCYFERENVLIFHFKICWELLAATALCLSVFSLSNTPSNNVPQNHQSLEKIFFHELVYSFFWLCSCLIDKSGRDLNETHRQSEFIFSNCRKDMGT